MICPECKGHGTVAKYKTVTCPICHGTGKTFSFSFEIGPYGVVKPKERENCPRCDGTGKLRDGLPEYVPCKLCGGRGTIYEEQSARNIGGETMIRSEETCPEHDFGYTRRREKIVVCGRCQGAGIIHKNGVGWEACPVCGGTGYAEL